MCSGRLFQIGEHTGAAWCGTKDLSSSWQLLPLVYHFLSYIFLLLLPLSAQVGTSCVFTVFSFQPLSVAFSASPHSPFSALGSAGSPSTVGGTGWTGASPVSTGEKVMSTDKSSSPYTSGWRRLDCVMGKSMCVYF